MAGRNKSTAHILINAPLDINRHKELIISISEYTLTPTVDAKKLNADTITGRRLL